MSLEIGGTIFSIVVSPQVSVTFSRVVFRVFVFDFKLKLQTNIKNC